MSFFAGEIDCRTGVPKSVLRGKYKSIAEAVTFTANRYVEALHVLAQEYGFFFT